MLKAIIGGLALAGLAVWWGRRAAAGIQDGIDGLTVDIGDSGQPDDDSVPNASPAF